MNNILRRPSEISGACEEARKQPVKYRTLNLNKPEDVDVLMRHHAIREVEIVDGQMKQCVIGNVKFIRHDYNMIAMVVDRPKVLRYFVQFKHPFFGFFQESFETQEAADSWKQLAKESLNGLTNEMFTEESKEVEL